jgi:surface polysaccharide O-acyltransferase-like enzyme
VTGQVAHSRETRLDALKGYAILCVVTYHALGQYFTLTNGVVVYDTVAIWMRAFLFSYMLPLFAFLSGYVLGRPGGFRPGTYFGKRTLGLLVPYVVWETLYGPSKHPEMLKSVSNVAGYYVHIFNNPHYEGRMWYLYVLWIALMFLGVARLRGDRTWTLLLSLPLVWVFGTYVQFFWLRWVYLFVVFGLLARRYEDWVLPRLKWLGIAGGIAFVPLWLVSEPEQLAATRFAALVPPGPLQSAGLTVLPYVPILAGICAVVAIIAASYHIPDALEEPLADLGILSLGIYITHFPFVEMWYDKPLWFLPINVVLATAVAVGWTLVLGKFRVTAMFLLGEPWSKRARPLGDVDTETL